jgi:hypothetical protein
VISGSDSKFPRASVGFSVLRFADRFAELPPVRIRRQPSVWVYTPWDSRSIEGERGIAGQRRALASGRCRSTIASPAFPWSSPSWARSTVMSSASRSATALLATVRTNSKTW